MKTCNTCNIDENIVALMVLHQIMIALSEAELSALEEVGDLAEDRQSKGMQSSAAEANYVAISARTKSYGKHRKAFRVALQAAFARRQRLRREAS